MELKTPSRGDIRGPLYSVLADLRREAKSLIKTPSYLEQVAPNVTPERVARALAGAVRLEEFHLSGAELAAVYAAEIDCRGRLGQITDKPAADVFRWEAIGAVLKPEPAADLAGKTEYDEAVELLLAEEARRARLAALPPIKSANTILSTEYPAPRFLVPGILPDSGIVCMAASKATGKTWALLQMAAAVATGGLAFGRIRCDCARVLFLELELSERRLRERFGKMRLDNLPGLDVATAWRSGAEGIADLEAVIKDRGYGLVIVDVLARLWPRGTDMNDYGSVYGVLGPLRDMANRLGCSVVLATHTRKAEAEDAIDQVMGSVGIVGTADVVLALKRTRGSDDAVLRIDGNDIESQEIVLQFRVDPMGFEAVDIDPRETRLTPERKEVLEALRGVEEAKATEIASIIGKDPDAVSKHLRALAGDRMAEVVRFGVYKASRSGRSSRSEQKDLPREYPGSSSRSTKVTPTGRLETPTGSTTPTVDYGSESIPKGSGSISERIVGLSPAGAVRIEELKAENEARIKAEIAGWTDEQAEACFKEVKDRLDNTIALAQLKAETPALTAEVMPGVSWPAQRPRPEALETFELLADEDAPPPSTIARAPVPRWAKIEGLS